VPAVRAAPAAGATAAAARPAAGAMTAPVWRKREAPAAAHTAAANDTVPKLASVFETAVKRIHAETDQLLKAAHESKVKFYEEVDSMAPNTLTPEFAASVSKLVRLVDAPWRVLGAVVKESAATIASEFEAAGQQSLYTAVEPEADAAVQSLGQFLEKLGSANLEIQNSTDDHVADHAEALLKRMEEKLNDASKHLSQFILQFRGAFTELFDSLSNPVCWSSTDAHAAFKPVRRTVASIVLKVRSAGQFAIYSIPTGILRIAQAAHMPAPVWHPVDIQVLPHRSANTTNGLP